MTTTTAPPGGHSIPLGLMSCVRESSPQDLVPQTDLVDIERNETKKRRFHPFRGLRKMFRRGASGTSGGTTGKVRNAGSEETVPVDNCLSGHDDTTNTKDAHRSRSTSELLSGDENSSRKKNNNGSGNGNGGGMYTGGGNLSVSHDSVFTAEQRSTRGDSTSSDLDTAQSSSSLSIQQLMHQTGVQAELLDVVRRRGRGRGDTSEDDEDLGLPRSPCNSPTTTNKALKEHPTKSHSTCSDGSLLSMGSSEMDEDSFGQPSRHSSKLSLHDRRPSQATDSELELGTTSVTAPLSHSAARHKMAVRPKRTHGAPRRRRVQQLTAGSALPTTPEVNEEVSTRSLTPEGSTARETIAELYSSSSTSMNKVWNMSNSVVTETQLKSASLPPGLALPSGSNKLSRSRSNAGKAFVEEEEEASKEEKKKEESFFGRFLARRSGKKKKSKSEDADVHILNSSKSVDKVEVTTTSISSSSSNFKYTEDKRTFSVDSGICKVARSGPAARQRIQPIDIPASPDSFRQNKRQQHMDIDLPMPPVTASSPDQTFLEASPPSKKMHVFLPKQTKVTSPLSVSPEKTIIPEPQTEISPSIPIPSPRTILPRKPSNPEVVSRTILPQSPPKSTHEIIIPAPRTILPNLSPPKLSTWADTQPIKSQSDIKFSEHSSTTKEECKTKVKITGLSSYQQRFMSYNDEADNGFKSLEETSEQDSISAISLTKSQSFRSKSIINTTQEHTSLPYTVNSLPFDTNSESETYTDSLMSTTTPLSDQSDNVTVNKDTDMFSPDNEINIINTNAEINNEHIISTNLEKKEEFVENSSSSVFITNEKETIEKIENKDEGITISCVNTQMQASVNTKSSNQVVVSISNTSSEQIPLENKDVEMRDTSSQSQVSITKVQLKKDAKPIVIDTPTAQVPEFLKIQLHKVDVKSPTNVVLATSNTFEKTEDKEKPKQKTVLEIETDRESGEIITDNIKRKFSTDVDVIEKDTSDETPEIPTKNPSKNIKSLPIAINNSNAQSRKSSLVTVSPLPSNKPFLKKKSNSLELGDSIKIVDSNKPLANSTDQLSSKTENIKEKSSPSSSDSEKQDGSPPEVVMRKKSLVSQKRDKDSDEPELMKVFARRSLKLKDSEVETLSQQVMVMVEADKNAEVSENNKRDSDKENECAESPVEERKKATFSSKEVPKSKEPLCESKFVETADVTLRKPSPALNNKLSVFGGSKYQRTVSLSSAVPNNDVNDNTTNEDKRRNKSFIEPKTEKKPVITNYRSPHILNIREKDIEIKTSTDKCVKNDEEFKKDFENEDYVPRFKRIQQRKEEWEKRAQQNMKKSVP